MPRLSERARATRWRDLPPAARAYRVFHAAWSVAGLAAFGHVWRCAVTGHRDRILWASIGFLALEGAGLVVGRGDCPMGEVQERMGDPVPFFELVLPPRAAKAAVPILAAGSVAGMAVIAARMTGGWWRAREGRHPGRRAVCPAHVTAGSRAGSRPSGRCRS